MVYVGRRAAGGRSRLKVSLPRGEAQRSRSGQVRNEAGATRVVRRAGKWLGTCCACLAGRSLRSANSKPCAGGLEGPAATRSSRRPRLAPYLSVQAESQGQEAREEVFSPAD